MEALDLRLKPNYDHIDYGNPTSINIGAAATLWHQELERSGMKNNTKFIFHLLDIHIRHCQFLSHGIQCFQEHFGSGDTKNIFNGDKNNCHKNTSSTESQPGDLIKKRKDVSLLCDKTKAAKENISEYTNQDGSQPTSHDSADNNWEGCRLPKDNSSNSACINPDVSRSDKENYVIEGKTLDQNTPTTKCNRPKLFPLVRMEPVESREENDKRIIPMQHIVLEPNDCESTKEHASPKREDCNLLGRDDSMDIRVPDWECSSNNAANDSSIDINKTCEDIIYNIPNFTELLNEGNQEGITHTKRSKSPTHSRHTLTNKQEQSIVRELFKIRQISNDKKVDRDSSLKTEKYMFDPGHNLVHSLGADDANGNENIDTLKIIDISINNSLYPLDISSTKDNPSTIILNNDNSNGRVTPIDSRVLTPIMNSKVVTDNDLTTNQYDLNQSEKISNSNNSLVAKLLETPVRNKEHFSARSSNNPSKVTFGKTDKFAILSFEEVKTNAKNFINSVGGEEVSNAVNSTTDVNQQTDPAIGSLYNTVKQTILSREPLRFDLSFLLCVTDTVKNLVEQVVNQVDDMRPNADSTGFPKNIVSFPISLTPEVSPRGIKDLHNSEAISNSSSRNSKHGRHFSEKYKVPNKGSVLTKYQNHNKGNKANDTRHTIGDNNSKLNMEIFVNDCPSSENPKDSGTDIHSRINQSTEERGFTEIGDFVLDPPCIDVREETILTAEFYPEHPVLSDYIRQIHFEDSGRSSTNRLMGYKVRRIRGRKSYSCNFCALTFYSLKDIQLHIKENYSATGEEAAALRKPVIELNNEHLGSSSKRTCRSFECEFLFCDQSFPRRKQLNEHMIDDHGSVCAQNSLSCEFCGKRFFKMKNLILHKRRHLNPKYKSPKVGFGARDYRFLERERFRKNQSCIQKDKSTTKDTPSHCNLCELTFKKRREMLIHMNEVHHETDAPEKQTSCLKDDHRIQAMKEKSGRPRRTSKEKVCDLCDCVFADSVKLAEHLKTVHLLSFNSGIGLNPARGVKLNERKFRARECHNVKKALQCDFCDKNFPKRAELTKHVKMDHPAIVNLSIITGETDGVPDTIERDYEVIGDIQIKGRKIYSCDFCTFMFVKQKHLTIHLKEYHRNCQYQCQVCDKMFTNKSRWKTHLKYHEPNPKFKCNDCQKTFPFLFMLNTHRKRVHEQVKSYQCQFCGKQFYTARVLRDHLLIHTKERPYVCPVCSKAFTQAFNLKRHMFMHTGEKPYSCDICLKSFRGSSDLRRHQLTHSSIRPHRCELCDLSFRQLSHLNTHRKKQHVRKCMYSL